jgi:hypothetical protein
MQARPKVCGDEQLVCCSPIDERHRFTGACKQIVAGQAMGAMAGSMICFIEQEQAYYLYGCDRYWKTITDTWHSSVDDAKHQAEFEYDGISRTWIAV